MPMDTPSHTHLSPEEWQALQTQGPALGRAFGDVWFPVRAWFLLFVTTLFALGLLFSAPQLARYLSHEPAVAEMLTRFLYFRGWFVVALTVLGLYAYLKDWHTRRVFLALTVLGTMNLVSDLFIVYPERLEHPTWGFTVLLMLRVLALGAVWQCWRQADRLPAPQDRLKFWLPIEAARARAAQSRA